MTIAGALLGGLQLQLERDDLTLYDYAVGCGGEGGGLELARGEAEEFELPGVAVDQQQLAHADVGVEVELLAAAVGGADDFDDEIGAGPDNRAVAGAAVPVRIAVFG
jgi:hypothetical protein